MVGVGGAVGGEDRLRGLRLSEHAVHQSNALQMISSLFGNAEKPFTTEETGAESGKSADAVQVGCYMNWH
jgi:hypothetical protein